MSLTLARRDFTRITQLGFGVDVKIQPSSIAVATEIKALATKHHFSINEEGLPVNSKNVHITLSESILVDAGYIVRNSDNEVALVDHLVIFTDSSENEWIYKITQTMPDETLGQITCFLRDYE